MKLHFRHGARRKLERRKGFTGDVAARNGTGGEAAMSTSRRKLVVLTPVKNEEWRIRFFLESALAWADHIILSDQGSTDSTVSIASSFDRVTILHNSSIEFNELENRNRLLDHCRLNFGNCVVFSLDADECLSAGIFDNEIRQAIDKLPGGTGIRIPHANLVGDSYWTVELDPIAFVDDGRSTTVTSRIHFPRTCFVDFPNGIVSLELFALHLQYLDEGRYRSKIDWYQLLEVTELGRRDFLGLYRQYHHFDSVAPSRLRPIAKELTEGYSNRGISPLGFLGEKTWWWESASNAMTQDLAHSVRARLILRNDNHEVPNICRFDRAVRKYLSTTQRFYRPSYVNPLFLLLYLVDRVIGPIWNSNLWRRALN